MTTRALTLGMLIFTFACGDDGGDGSSFGSTAPTASGDPSAGDAAGDSDDSSDDSAGDSDDAGTTTSGESDGGGGSDDTDGGTAGGGDTAGGGTTGGSALMCPADMGDRPGTGQYSCCTVEGDEVTGCGTAPNNFCIHLDGLGYCTNTMCEDPTTDCEVAPGSTATATPICVPLEDANSCALDCSTGDCPTGMTCQALLFGDDDTVFNICL